MEALTPLQCAQAALVEFWREQLMWSNREITDELASWTPRLEALIADPFRARAGMPGSPFFHEDSTLRPLRHF